MRVLCFLLLLATTAQAQQPPHEFLVRMYQRLQSEGSMKYDVTEMEKAAAQTDPVIHTGAVYFLRADDDPIFKGYVWTSADGNNMFTFYDLAHVYTVHRDKQTYSIHEPAAYANNLPLVWSGITDPEGCLKKDTAATDTLSRLDDTTVNGAVCYHIRVRYPGQDTASEKMVRTDYCINKDFVPVLVTTTISEGDGYSYKQWNITSYKFNAVTRSFFSHEQIPTNYRQVSDDK